MLCEGLDIRRRVSGSVLIYGPLQLPSFRISCTFPQIKGRAYIFGPYEAVSFDIPMSARDAPYFNQHQLDKVFPSVIKSPHAMRTELKRRPFISIFSVTSAPPRGFC